MAFFSTYKLYKKGTSQVVAWLGKTATQLGYELGLGDSPKLETQVDTSKQVKETEKTKSKSNGKSSIEPESQGTKYMVTTKELPLLARFISEHFRQTPDFKTLPGILEILNDVIVKRKHWAKAFGLPDATTLASNIRHKHFVTVLEDVYKTLRGIVGALHPDQEETSVLAISVEKSSSMEEIALSNLFAVLDIEEPAGHEEDTPKPTRGVSPSRLAAITYELEDDIDDEDEFYFMIYCFFKDFVSIRKHIRQSWADYAQGLLDLSSVAVTTNVALQMMQRAERTLLATLAQIYNVPTDYKAVGGLLLSLVASMRGVDPDFRQKRDDVINMDLQDIADFTCLPVYIILWNVLPMVEGQNVPHLKPGHFETLDMTGQPLPWVDTFHQNKIVLCELLTEVCVFKMVRMKIPVVDELSRGLLEMMKTKVVPTWLVFGCQIYLDLHHLMLSSMGMAHKDLQAMGLHVSTTLQNYLDFSKEMWINTWPEGNDMNLRSKKLEADLWVNRDYFGALQTKFISVNQQGWTTRPYSLLSRHPLICGLMLFRLSLGLHDAGVCLVSVWGTLPSVVHLYNAVKREFSEYGFPLWQDVESIIQIQGKERIFMGDYPKDAVEYLKRFYLAMGYSATFFAQNRRGGRPTPQSQTPASSRGPREMITTSAICDIFQPQYCENEARSEVTIHKIVKLLSSSTLGNSVATSANHRPRQFTSVSFLSSLQEHLQADILALNINYLALHIRCTTLLRNINVKLGPEFLKYLGPGYLERECQLPFLVGHVFQIATGSKKAATRLKLAGRGVVGKSALLMKAGEVVKEVVLQEGDAEVERVRNVCRGYDRLQSNLVAATGL